MVLSFSLSSNNRVFCFPFCRLIYSLFYLTVYSKHTAFEVLFLPSIRMYFLVTLSLLGFNGQRALQKKKFCSK